jgi:hypothetical protein
MLACRISHAHLAAKVRLAPSLRRHFLLYRAGVGGATYRAACDTVQVLGPSGADGVVLSGKVAGAPAAAAGWVDVEVVCNGDADASCTREGPHC